VTIVCGPLFEGEARYIGRNKVQVPSGFFKVVYREKPSPKAIGFIFANNGKPQPWREQACSVDDVEERTGINFFPQLPDDLEDLLESEELLRDW
jgi:endonuclease G